MTVNIVERRADASGERRLTFVDGVDAAWQTRLAVARVLVVVEDDVARELPVIPGVCAVPR